MFRGSVPVESEAQAFELLALGWTRAEQNRRVSAEGRGMPRVGKASP